MYIHNNLKSIINDTNQFSKRINEFYSSDYAYIYNTFGEMKLYKKYCCKILDQLLIKHFESNIDNKSIVIDAGGGTGRFARILVKRTKANVVLVDISKGMLSVANYFNKIHCLEENITLYNASIDNMSFIQNESIDAVMSIFDPIAYLDNPEDAIIEFDRVCKKDAVATIVIDNFYDCIHFLSKEEKLAELESLLKTKRMRWVDRQPSVKAFTVDDIYKLFDNVDWEVEIILGFPIFLYPSTEDTRPDLQDSSSSILSDPTIFNYMVDLELKWISEENAARGNHFFVVARKK